jgi:hypothetical protein
MIPESIIAVSGVEDIKDVRLGCTEFGSAPSPLTVKALIMTKPLRMLIGV